MNIKIIDLNIWEGGVLFDQAVSFLKAENPDVICLQEVCDGQNSQLPRQYQTTTLLKETLPEYELYFGGEILQQREVGHIVIGNATLSKLPIQHQQTHFISKSYGTYPELPGKTDWSQDPKNMIHTELVVDDKVLNIFNMHGIWGLDGADTPERLEMSQKIITQIKDKPKVVLTGDFNIKPNTQTIFNIENYLTNVFKDELTTTFNLSRKNLKKFPGYATAVVDMFFVSPDLKVVSHHCPEVDASDHLPLVVEIEL